MPIKFLDLQKNYLLLKDELDKAVLNVFKRADFIKSEEVSRFGASFAAYCGAKRCICCGNGTDALTILIKSLNLPEKSCVIVPANTFVATAEAVIANGLEVKFADVDDDFTMSPDSLNSLMDSKVSAVIAVHLYGLPAKIDKLKKITEKWGIPLIEDAAQAHGAMIGTRKAGNLANGAAFSFYPGKVLGAAGDAGAIVLNDDNLADKIAKYCDHGRNQKYLHQFAGINSRMDAIQAAVLNVKLNWLESWIASRNRVAEKYYELLSGVENIVLPPKPPQGVRSARHLFVIKTPKRDELQEYLRKNGIETKIHYPFALPQLPFFAEHSAYCADYRAVKESSRLLSLPIGEHLSDEDVEKIAETIKTAIKNNFR